MYKKPKLTLETTTLWDYPSQHYGSTMQGDRSYKGATPSYVIWNLLQRFTRKGDLVLDPMVGSGTTLDVARDLGRESIGFDLQPQRPEIGFADARRLPLKKETVDFAFIDPPYSTHLKYSGLPACIGELDAAEPAYYAAMEEVMDELRRVLKNQRYLGLYVSDSWRMDEPFCPIGFELFARLRQRFTPVDIIAVTRHNRTMKHDHWARSATAGNYFLRGFNYLFIMKKEDGPKDLTEGPRAAARDIEQAAAGEWEPPAREKPVRRFGPPGKKKKKKKHRI